MNKQEYIEALKNAKNKLDTEDVVGKSMIIALNFAIDIAELIRTQDENEKID